MYVYKEAVHVHVCVYHHHKRARCMHVYGMMHTLAHKSLCAHDVIGRWCDDGLFLKTAHARASRLSRCLCGLGMIDVVTSASIGVQSTHDTFHGTKIKCSTHAAVADTVVGRLCTYTEHYSYCSALTCTST